MGTNERVAHACWPQKGTNKKEVPLFHVEWMLSDCKLACSDVGNEKDAPVASLHVGAKFRALLADLEELRRADGSEHAVVFTNHTRCFMEMRDRVAAAGFDACGFKGGDAVNKCLGAA